MRKIILTLSAISLIICSLYLIQYHMDTIRAREELNELIAVIEAARENTIIETIERSTKKPDILPQYKELYEQNSDLIGWVKIEGTELNYPVMYTPDDGEYYLHRNFEKEYEYSGLPFLDKNCSIDPPSTNLIIYGHNMKNDTMFSSLSEYRNEEYFIAHPTVIFDTVYEESEYEIIAVILSQVYKKSDNAFKFYQFIEADSEEHFNEFINNIKKLALYETGISAEYGDLLITLTTCAYHTENGRLAVIAKKIQ